MSSELWKMNYFQDFLAYSLSPIPCRLPPTIKAKSTSVEMDLSNIFSGSEQSRTAVQIGY
jgi:hypothetical protein